MQPSTPTGVQLQTLVTHEGKGWGAEGQHRFACRLLVSFWVIWLHLPWRGRQETQRLPYSFTLAQKTVYHLGPAMRISGQEGGPSCPGSREVLPYLAGTFKGLGGERELDGETEASDYLNLGLRWAEVD